MQHADQAPLAVVTDASTGIGWALARQFVDRGYDLVVVAEDAELHDAASGLRRDGRSVLAQQVDLATARGVEELHEAIAGTGRPVAAAALNAGIGSSGCFHRTPLEADLEVVDLNVRSMVHLSKLLLPSMVDRGDGRLLFTASVAGPAPAQYLATYAASTAFVHLFAQALRHELRGTGVTVTSLLPDPTDASFFDGPEMRDARVGRIPRDDPDEVAREAYAAMMAGKDRVVAGSVLNRVSALGSVFLPLRLRALAQAFLAKSQPGGR